MTRPFQRPSSTGPEERAVRHRQGSRGEPSGPRRAAPALIQRHLVVFELLFDTSTGSAIRRVSTVTVEHFAHPKTCGLTTGQGT